MRTPKPESVEVALTEGGNWVPLGYYPNQSVYAIKFKDGSVWDVKDGWRVEEETPWKPMREYQEESDGHINPVVLARDKAKLVYLVTKVDGEFILCPGIPIFYGNHQCGWTKISGLVEFMEIPK